MPNGPQKRHLVPGRSPGRPKGARNRKSLEIEAFSRQVLEDPSYQTSLKKRLKEGKAPHVESLLFHYAYGKPVERVEVTGQDGAPLHIHLTWGDHASDDGSNGLHRPAALAPRPASGADESGAV